MLKFIRDWFLIMIALIIVVYLIASIYSGTFNTALWIKETRDFATGVISVLGMVMAVIVCINSLD